jgi:hypothetical protein
MSAPSAGRLSRRGLIAGAPALLAAPAVATTLPPATAATVPIASPAPQCDAVVSLAARYRELLSSLDEIEAQLDSERSALAARLGVSFPLALTDAERRGPDFMRLDELLDESDRLSCLLGDVLDELLVTPASTPFGIACKCDITLLETGNLFEWDGRNKCEPEAFQELIIATLRDGVALLGDGKLRIAGASEPSR